MIEVEPRRSLSRNAAIAGQSIVIIGAGQAGGDLAASMRELGFSGDITLIGAEEHHPYSRHHLSKGYLIGEKDDADVLIRAADTYARFDITIKVGERAESIDREAKQVALCSGGHVSYDALVLATGGSPRMLPGPTLQDVGNVFYLRSLQDAARLRSRLTPGARLTVVGGGFIGLEVAAVARHIGLDVTVVEREERLLARVTSAVTSAFFARRHREEGVVLHLGRSVLQAIPNGDGDVAAIVLDDGTVVATDVCLVGVGLEPDTALAFEAGLDVDDGVVVDASFRTSDDAIFAIGDVARYPCADQPGTQRLESIPNSSEHARALARTLVGESTAYGVTPWFWSDQYDLKYQAVGLMRTSDDVVLRGDPGRDRAISVFYVGDGVIRAAEVFSSPRDFATAKKLVTRRIAVTREELADSAVPLRDLLA